MRIFNFALKKNKDLSLYTTLIDQIEVIEYEPYSIKKSKFCEENYQTFLDKNEKSLQNLTNKNWRMKL